MPKQRTTLTCPVCHEQFERPHWDYRRSRAFCSRSCSNRARSASIDDAELIRLYVEEGMSGVKIAARFGVAFSAVYRRLHELVDVKTNSEAHVGLTTREDNPNWKGGRWVGSNGYIWLNLDGHVVMEHRHVAEKSIGRKLLDGEVVHHKNHVKTDNRPENLQVLKNQSEHVRLHALEGAAKARGAKGNASRYAHLDHITPEHVANLRSQGMSIYAIAKKLGHTRTFVEGRLRRCALLAMLDAPDARP